MKHLFDMGGCETIAADSQRQALDLWCEFTTEDEEDYKDGLTQIPDDEEIAIRWDLDMLENFSNQIPTEAEFEFCPELGNYQVLTTALARRWAEITPTPTIICSTEW